MIPVTNALIIAKEVEKLTLEGMTFDEALDKAIEIYKETRNTADQSNSYENKKTFNDIVSDSEDLDNGGIYNIETGETVKEL